MAEVAPSIASGGSSISSASIWKKTVRRLPTVPLSNLLPTRGSSGGEASTSSDHSDDGPAGDTSEPKLAPKPAKPPTAKETKLLAQQHEVERRQATTGMLVRMGFEAKLAEQAFRQARGDPTRAVNVAVHLQDMPTAIWAADCTVCRRSMAEMYGCTPDDDLVERFVDRGWAPDDSAFALAKHGNNIKDTGDHLMHKAHGGNYDPTLIRRCNWCQRRRLAEYVLRVPMNKTYPDGWKYQGEDAAANELFCCVKVPYLHNGYYDLELGNGGGGAGSWVVGRPDGHGATSASATVAPPNVLPAPAVPAPSRRAMRTARATGDSSMGMGMRVGAGAPMAASMAATSAAMGGGGGGGGGGC